jgi:hypothetical protein
MASADPAKPVAKEQEVGAWSVDQGVDAEGNVLPLNYDQIRE